ncbi:hypothetical protein HAPAU_41470 [Halalkalicoccus paucihalophilus]|uniref:Uncharacterized protein n=1 Tax=Halalkalicoccus paucihalophilus TaxID=1008153 RepID=A0A151A8P7_9EURY|nr:hypothetical protein HAPAU_41470 [Halalkalicoccus paucihalophilus]
MKYKPPLSKPTADYTLLLDESRLRTEDLWNELADQGASRLGSVLTNSKGCSSYGTPRIAKGAETIHERVLSCLSELGEKTPFFRVGMNRRIGRFT